RVLDDAGRRARGLGAAAAEGVGDPDDVADLAAVLEEASNRRAEEAALEGVAEDVEEVVVARQPRRIVERAAGGEPEKSGLAGRVERERRDPVVVLLEVDAGGSDVRHLVGPACFESGLSLAVSCGARMCSVRSPGPSTGRGGRARGGRA